jgi:hypothetical protein
MTRKLKNAVLYWVLSLIVIGLAEDARADVILDAFDNATIQPTGPRTGANGQLFFNIEGSDNGQFASFGVADFMPSAMNVAITSLTLTLTQANASFTHNGSLLFYISGDTTTSIDPGTSPLFYDGGALPTGLGTQLSPTHFLGTGMFTEVADGTVDSFNFTLDMATTVYLDSQLSMGGPIRVIVAPGDAAVAATYAGFSNTDFSRPQLSLTTVPEPSTFAGIGLVLLFASGASRGRRAARRLAATVNPKIGLHSSKINAGGVTFQGHRAEFSSRGGRTFCRKGIMFRLRLFSEHVDY